MLFVAFNLFYTAFPVHALLRGLNPGRSPISVTSFGGNALVYGAMGATYSAFQLVGAPILGRWSDVQGRRKILLMSQLGTLASWFVFLGALFLPAVALFEVDSRLIGSFLLTLPLAVLFLARALDGLTGGNVSVANAYLADVTDADERNVNFGKMAAAGNLGFILGPTLSGLLGATVYGEAIPVMAALLISVAASYVIAFHLPESKPCALGENPEQTNVRKVFGQEQVDCYKVEDKVTFKAVLKLEMCCLSASTLFCALRRLQPLLHRLPGPCATRTELVDHRYRVLLFVSRPNDSTRSRTTPGPRRDS